MESSAKMILAKINGLNPNQEHGFEYHKQRYKVLKAKIVDKNGRFWKTLI